MTDYLRQQLQSYLTVISTLMTVRYMAYVSLFLTTVSRCLDSIDCWMRSNRLQLNTDKTEVM